MVKKAILLSLGFIIVSKIVLSQDQNILSTVQPPLSPQPEVLGLSSSQFTAPYVFAALPAFDNDIQTSVKTADARAEIIRQYLHKFNSPLEPYSELIVQLSDTYNFDYRWLVAIAQQESNLCKHIPANSYNCWGWGIYPDPDNPEVLKVTRFDSYEDALRRIAPQFTKIFLKGKHTKDPAEVMKTYTPPSDGSWADGVNSFFDSLK